MEYYNSEYPRMTIENLKNVRVQLDFVDYNKDYQVSLYLGSDVQLEVDIIVKGNYIYKVTKTTWTIKNEEKLFELIDFLTLKSEFVLESSKSGKTVLKTPTDTTVVHISSVNNEYLAEHFRQDLIDTIN